MITSVGIEHFKGIERLTLPLGRVNVLIGENGGGKSAILQAIGLGAAVASHACEAADLSERGLFLDPRYVPPWFRACAPKPSQIRFDLCDGQRVTCSWHNNVHLAEGDADAGALGALRSFVLFALQGSCMRAPPAASQGRRLGPSGEGLLFLLQDLFRAGQRDELQAHLAAFFPSFQDIEVVGDERDGWKLRLRSEHLYEDDGFLYSLFFLALFLSPSTPRFLGLEDVEHSLNPKLCQHLLRLLVTLTKKNNKQVILTTHSPALLDAINLHDDDERIFVVSRTRDDSEGRCRVRRIGPPRPDPGQLAVRLSEAFLRGYLGGLPTHF